jgi:hypothetical protein
MYCFLYGTYEINCVKEDFAAGILVFWVLATSAFLEFGKKVNSTGSALDNKYTGQDTVLTEGELDQNWAR